MPRRNKYGAKKTTVDGIVFDSGREAARYRELRLLEQVEEIRDLRHQVTYRLEVNGLLVCSYRADFIYWDRREETEIVEDAKGFRTPEYRLKAKLMRACHGIVVREV